MAVLNVTETGNLETGTLQLPVEIISQFARLDVAVQAMAREPAIALDTESNSFHHYPEQLCLIQIATRHKVYIIDTITLKDIAPLKDVLENDSIEKIVHGADYDIRSLDRHCGFHIRNLYDTNIAGRFAGMTRVSLGALIEDLLGITIEKSKRLQRANWGQRPLSAEALIYAAADVRYLLSIRNILDQRLQALGRAAWVAEECARLEEVRYTAPNLDTAFLSAKGSKNLDERGLAILQSLFQFREEEARRWRRPPFFVTSDEALIFIAANPTVALTEVPGIGQTGLQRFGRGILQALRDGLAAPPIRRALIMAAERVSREQLERLRCLKEWRLSQGEALSVDPTLLWPMASLERLSRAPDTFTVELTSENIRRWQRDNLASSLRTYLQSLP